MQIYVWLCSRACTFADVSRRARERFLSEWFDSAAVGQTGSLKLTGSRQNVNQYRRPDTVPQTYADQQNDAVCSQNMYRWPANLQSVSLSLLVEC